MGHELNSLLFSFFLQKYMQLLNQFEPKYLKQSRSQSFSLKQKGKRRPETLLFPSVKGGWKHINMVVHADEYNERPLIEPETRDQIPDNQQAWGPFLERPGNLSGPKSHFSFNCT